MLELLSLEVTCYTFLDDTSWTETFAFMDYWERKHLLKVFGLTISQT